MSNRSKAGGYRAVAVCLLNAYASGEEAVRGIVPAQRPDVVVVDIKLPGMSGFECVAKLKALLPQLQVLMLTTYEERDLIFNSLRAGARLRGPRRRRCRSG